MVKDKIRLIPFEEKYRDDLIYMILDAKNALGRVPGLNEDLLDIKSFYFDKDGMFWLALDENDRVVGSCGFLPEGDGKIAWLHRLFVKATLKRQGIGTALLQIAEMYAKERGTEELYVHLGGDGFFESRNFYPKHGFVQYEPDYMKKLLI